LPNVYFTGRLGTYKYYNMDQVVAQSLTLFKKIIQDGENKETHPYLPVAGGKETQITKFKFDANGSQSE
jgi:UDP-galactopyranose mutase